MSKHFLKAAPNLKHQDQTGEKTVIVYVGSQAWDFAKVPPPPRSKDEIELAEALGEEFDNTPPVVIDNNVLEEIETRQIAPKKAFSIKICRANNAQPLANDRFYALYLNLADNNPNLQRAVFVDEANQLIEDLMPYIRRIREDKEAKEIAKMSADQNKSEWEKQADYLETFKQLSPKERLIEFLEWGKYSFAFNPVQGNAIYTFTGIKWEMLSDEMIARLVNEFFISKGFLKFGDTQIKNIIKCIPASSEFVPLMESTNPELLAFKNGVLNKRTGEFQPHRKDDFLTSFLDIEYSQQEQSTPNFNQWLDFVSEDNPERRKRILAALYFVLTNRYEWQLFLEIIGEGGSGKSTFTAIAELLAGAENTTSISLKSLENPTLRCGLLNKTLVICPDQKKYIGEGEELKSVTGQDIISFNPKYKDPFDDRVKAVFIITGNEPMIFTENNGGVDRRRIIFKFDRVVPKEQRDYYLINKIKGELNGIINLLLDMFQNPADALHLLEDQKYSKEAMQVKQDTDHLLDFLNAFYTKDEPFARGLFLGRPKQTQANVHHSWKEYLLSAYDLYCRINDINKPIGKNRFKSSIEKAIKKKRMHPPLKISIFDGKNRTNIYFNNAEKIEDEWLNS